MLEIIVLGSGAGGGFPQWNSAAPACLMAREGKGAKPRTQVSIAVSADSKNWFLLNAAPDLRQQILSTPALLHYGSNRGTPIQGVILAGAEIDATIGLLTLREREAFALIASASTLSQIAANPMFGALAPDLVTRQAVTMETPIPLMLKNGEFSGMTLEAFPVPGKAPLYAEAQGPQPEETIGLSLSDGIKTMMFVPGCAEITDSLIARVAKADLLFFDGTLWRDDEMVRAGLSHKTGHRMGHVSVNEADGPLKRFAGCTRPEKVFLHINNSNPLLIEGSIERRLVEEQGWRVAEDGMNFYLT